MKDINSHDAIRLFKHKNYRYFDDIGKVNIFGIRKARGIVSKFDDIICILVNEKDGWVLHKFNATTDPGLHYMKKLLNPKGTAILMEGQYKGSHILGKHGNKYEALVQRGARVTVFRDNNQNAIHDFNMPIQRGFFGINIHRASKYKVVESIGKYSAGCQVIQNPNDFETFLSLCKRSAKLHGGRFDYTLFNQMDLFASLPLTDIPIRDLDKIPIAA